MKSDRIQYRRALCPLVCLLSTLLLTAGQARAEDRKVVNLPDYLPMDPGVYCTRTLRSTYGPYRQFTSEIVGQVTVPYSSGAVTGSLFTGDWTEGVTLGISNDGTTVHWGILLEPTPGDLWYGTSDCALSSFPSGWSFGTIADNTVRDLGILRVVKPDFSACETDQNSELVLLDIQDVKVLQGLYQDAVILWGLSNNQEDEYVPPDFKGREQALKIVPPSLGETQNHALRYFLIFGVDAGVIAGGEIDVDSGDLTNMYELASVECAPVSGAPPLSAGFSQLALGGGYESVVFLSNRSNQPWEGTVRLLEGNRQTWSHSWSLDGTSRSGTGSFDVTLPARATRKYVVGGDLQVRAGYLEVERRSGGSESLTPSLFYHLVQGGRLVDSMGISAGAASTRFWFPVEKAADANTGFAYAPETASNPFGVRLQLFDASGGLVQTRNMESHGHEARFFAGPDGVFTGISDGFVGAILVEAQQPLLLTVIRMEVTPTGIQLTSVAPESRSITATAP